MSQLAFGSPPGSGAGDACGTLLQVDRYQGPVLAELHGPVLQRRRKDHRSVPCPGQPSMVRPKHYEPCQLVRHIGAVRACPSYHLCQLAWLNKKYSRSFDLCQDSGAANAFFPSGHGALTGTYEEVSCSEWSGTDGSSLWNGACLNDENSPSWPSTGSCGNKGTELSLPNSRNALVHVYCRHCTINKWSEKTKMSY